MTQVKPVKVISTHAAAAKAIRQYMKANGIVGSATSESYSMGSSVNVYVTDMAPATYETLSTFVKQFQYGNFNGMEDIYEYSNDRKDLPQVKYAFTNNKISDEMRQKIWDFALGYYNVLGDAPKDAKAASNYRIVDFQQYGSELIYRLFAGGYNENMFWDFVNNEQMAA